MRRFLWISLIGTVSFSALIGFTPQQASAALTFDFAGTVTQTPTFTPGGFDDPFGGTIDFGTALEGSYTFDALAPDLIAASGSGSYQSSSSPFGATVVIAGHTFTVTDFLAVNVLDSTPDHYSVLACAGGIACTDLKIELVFQDNEGAMLSDDALPLIPPDLTTLELKDFHLVAFIDSTEVQIDGQITTLSAAAAAVPEPGTLVLIGAGLAGLLAGRRVIVTTWPSKKGRTSMQSIRISALLVAAFISLVLAVPRITEAIDGQVLITQARAMSGGVTPLDTAGFPVTISQPGSYKLASNLTPPANTTGIEILASDVSLDLNGFSIIGQGGSPDSDGITTATALVARVTVKNGTVSGFSGNGVDLGGDVGTDGGGCRSCGVEDVVATSNGFEGIRVFGAGGSTVRNSKADFNQNGIAMQGGLMIGNTANNNSGVGLFINGGLATDNAAANNTGLGLQAGANLGYARNVFSGNNGANPEVSGGVNLGHNLCNAALCP